MFKIPAFLLAITGLSAMAPLPAKAEGSPLFAIFQRVCLDNPTDLAAMRAAAVAAGYSPIAAPNETLVLDGDGGRRYVAFTRSVQPGDPPVPKTENINCFVGQSSPDADFGAEADRWADVPADPDGPATATRAFAFTVLAGGAHQNVAESTGVDPFEVVRTTGVWMLLVMEKDQPSLALRVIRQIP